MKERKKEIKEEGIRWRGRNKEWRREGGKKGRRLWVMREEKRRKGGRKEGRQEDKGVGRKVERRREGS